MPRVPVHDLDSAPAAARDALAAQAQRVGKVLNIFGGMAHSPVLINLYHEVETHLREHSSLGEPTRQAIHLTVANVNGCDYCQAAYTGACLKAGFDEAQTLEIRRGRVEGDEKLTAMLALTREIARDRGDVDDATWNGALDAGWSEAQLLEGYAEVVRTILTNYFNHLVGTDIDLRPAPPLD